MKILFIQDNAINESLALTELSAFLKSKYYVCELLIAKEAKIIFKKIESFAPELLIFPCSLSGHNLWVLEKAKEIKRRWKQIPIVLGGIYPTLFPDIILNENIDIICLGEAELPILELVNKLEDKMDIRYIQGLWVKNNGNVYRNEIKGLIQDLDSLPLPDRELYYKNEFIRALPMKRFITGRGCMHRCSFCFNPLLMKGYSKSGKYVRYKSVNRVISEIEYIRLRYPLKFVHFSDDIFGSDKEWLFEFAKMYKKNISLPFSCNMSVDLIDEEKLMWLKKANCNNIIIGIECGNETLRRTVLNKDITNSQIIKVASLIKKFDIRLTTFNMIGLPGETVENIFETIELNKTIKSDFQRLQIIFPYPFSELSSFSLKHGYLDPAFFERKSLDKNLLRYSKRPRVYFNLTKKVQIENIYFFFLICIKFPILIQFVKKVINLPLTFLFSGLDLLKSYFEKKIFRIDWISGLRYFFHTGNPSKRTTNFHSLI